MKQIFLVFCAMCFAIGIANAQKKAAISATETVFDFGKITESEGKVTHTFQIKNTGNAPLVITRVIASCGCTTPKWTKEPIAAKKSAKIEVTYDPAGRPGPFLKSISVYSNGKSGSFVLRIKGDVVENNDEE